MGLPPSHTPSPFLVVLGKRKKKDFNGFRYFTLAVNRAADGFFFWMVGAAAL